MYDDPTPQEILDAAAAFLRDEIIPVLPAYQAFKTRILANALDLVKRQIVPPDGIEASALTRLTSLLGMSGTIEDLNKELASRLEHGNVALTDSALLGHLWTTTLDKLAVDQPNYASYRASTSGADR
jgi:hypothetical protein